MGSIAILLSRNRVLVTMLAGGPGNLTIAQLLSLAEISDVAGIASILADTTNELGRKANIWQPRDQNK